MCSMQEPSCMKNFQRAGVSDTSSMRILSIAMIGRPPAPSSSHHREDGTRVRNGNPAERYSAEAPPCAPLFRVTYPEGPPRASTICSKLKPFRTAISWA